MNIAVIGFARDGRASYAYFTEQGHQVTICDENTEIDLPIGAKSQLGPSYLDGLDAFDLIVRSSGIPASRITDKNPGLASKITSAVNEFLKICPTKNTIGVTGTKGKGTTSTLIVKMLESAGKKVHFGGNVGWSPLEFIHQVQEDDWVVLELSSFQLSDIQHSPHIGVCLMVVPEHLDWHRDLDEYFLSKAKLFEHQAAQDIAIYYAPNDDSKHIAGYSQGIKIPFYSPPGAYVEDGGIIIDDNIICKTDELQLLGEHNWQNVCAALTTVWQITQEAEPLRDAIINFTGLEHRLEFVAEKHGVAYYDDSFGTTPETAIVAIKAFKQPKVIILGGSDKQSKYQELAETVATHNVKAVIAIGEMGSVIAHQLRENGYNAIYDGGKTMQSIVEGAAGLAESGDVVLLSTACASFGMFKDYKDRGEQFKQQVDLLR